MMKYKNIILGIVGIALGLMIAWFLLPSDTQTSVKEVLGMSQGPQVVQNPNQGKSLDDVLASWGKDTRTVINGHPVPPMPNPKVNNATIAGVDSDNNGIRDDIDRYIADKFGNDPDMFKAAQDDYRTMITAMVNPTEANIREVDRSGACVAGNDIVKAQIMNTELSPMTRIIINTPERGRLYAKTFAGMTLHASCSDVK